MNFFIEIKKMYKVVYQKHNFKRNIEVVIQKNV